MSMGAARRLQVRHERLWADEAVELQFRLPFMNGILAFQATDPDTFPNFNGIVISHLLRHWQLDEMRTRGTGQRAPFVPAGTLYEFDDA